MSKNILRLFVVRGGVSLLIRRLRVRQQQQQLLLGSAAAVWEAAARWTTATTAAAGADRGEGECGGDRRQRQWATHGGRAADDGGGGDDASETLSPAKPYRSSRRYDGMGCVGRTGIVPLALFARGTAAIAAS